MIRRAMRLPLAILGALALLPLPASAAGETSIFYYPWWGTPARDGAYLHWGQNGMDPPRGIASDFYPARGPYSSADPSVLRAQMREIAAAGVGEVVASWWDWGSPEDLRLPAVMSAAKARGLSVAVQVEPFEKTLRTAAAMERDLGHLRDLGVRRVYVYRPFDDLVTDAEWLSINREASGMEMLAQTQNVARAAATGFDGVYTYDVLAVRGGSFAGLCDRARAAGLVCAPSVGPGYDARRGTGDPRLRSRRNGATYDAMWRAALAASPDRVTITSYNEWHEGTQIEAARPARGYESYEGAWRLTGQAAESAYLVRTAYWTRVYRVTAAAARALRVLAGLR